MWYNTIGDIMLKRKHRTNLLPIIIFLIIASFTILAIYDTFFKKDNVTESKPQSSLPIFMENEEEKQQAQAISEKFTKATVTRVVDGDTIIVNIDSKDYRVRLIGVNAPEYTSKKEAYGKEATLYTTRHLQGKTVYLEKDVSQTDQYDRLLRYVWLQIPSRFSEDEIKDKMFNAHLVMNGYAYAVTYPPDVKYTNYFKKFANFARKENLGLWATEQ